MFYQKIKVHLIILTSVLTTCVHAMQEMKGDYDPIGGHQHMTKSYSDVLIVGAGASGLTLALDLSRRGVTFQIIDKLEEPFKGSRGSGIQPRTQELFEDLGILDRAVAAGGIHPPEHIYDKEGGFKVAFKEHQDSTPNEPYHMSLMVPQFLTESIMRERLAELGNFPRFNCELKSLEQDSEGVTAHFITPKGEEIIRTRYLIGADGGHSFVRKAVNIGFPGETLGVRALFADCMIQGIGRDAWHRWNDGDMKNGVAIHPIAGTDLFQLLAPLPLEGDVDLSVEGLTALLTQRSGRNDMVVQSVSWASAFNMNQRLADHYSKGRIYLTGDAAHVHPPTGAQGLNTSVQDAYNLGWKLAAVLNGASEKLLLTYEEERRPIAVHVLELAKKILEAVKQGSTRLLREGVHHQLDLGYPQSSLALEIPKRSGGVLAGDRAPDAPVRGAGGQQTRLFKLFEGPHWTLLGYEVGINKSLVKPRPGLHIHTIGARGDILDDAGHFIKGYSVTPNDWVLVRPDGYIGAIVASQGLESLEAYLHNVGLTIKG